jgi:hypothetical protein
MSNRGENLNYSFRLLFKLVFIGAAYGALSLGPGIRPIRNNGGAYNEVCDESGGR